MVLIAWYVDKHGVQTKRVKHHLVLEQLEYKLKNGVLNMNVVAVVKY
jgi:hypothetical protein